VTASQTRYLAVKISENHRDTFLDLPLREQNKTGEVTACSLQVSAAWRGGSSGVIVISL
jgi:hypothetical protein